MTSESKVYIAGVGSSPSPSGGQGVVASLVSAATKALLDAGLTYDDVSHGVKGKESGDAFRAFKAFDEAGITIVEAKTESELNTSYDLIRKKSAQCVLMLTVEKSAAIALVLVSNSLLWRHPYLKDSAVIFHGLEGSQSAAEGSSGQGLQNVCKRVWALRGWTTQGPTGNSTNGFVFGRADAKAVPKWKDVEHRQDGKHRLGYNPAKETREISQEDFEAVKAIRERTKTVEDSARFKRKGGDRAALAKL